MKINTALVLLISLTLFSQENQLNQEMLQFLPEEIRRDVLEKTQNSNINNTIQLEENLTKEEVDYIQPSSRKFGFSFFEYSSNSNSPLLDMPLNSNYVLSLNDEIEVLLSGSINKVISGRINLSGSLFIPDIGTISLVNLNLTDANKKVIINCF